ncbi:MAG: isopentenyl-diphosphate Delta-isomerase, partial [Candidatus Levybacteria bacterium]|nr:isopentenyl-diphosphate Delta-isomerase [Candidatus Levybacteria bacterium]
ASHHAHTPLHLAFSCYVFNAKGKFLLTQRALSKKVWPGVWTNSCCGHPGPGEQTDDAVKRRLQYELGLVPLTVQLVLPDFRYRTEFNGIVENEICPVYTARVSSEPKPNPQEVEAYRWIPWEAFVANVTEHPERYSYWCVKQVAQLKDIVTLSVL